MGLILVALAFGVACGGDKTTTATKSKERDPAQDLPDPAEGMAVVGGQVLKNDEPVADQDVTLTNDTEKVEVKTDAEGRFVFPDVPPGNGFYLITTISAPGEMEGGMGIGFNEGPCKTTTAGFQIFAVGGKDASGNSIVIAQANNEPKRFDLEAGGRIYKKILFVCEENGSS